MELKRSTLTAALILALSPVAAVADEPASLIDAIKEGSSISSFRLRYEYVDQDSPVRDEVAQAGTLQTLLGWKTKPYKNFSFTAQVIGVSPFINDYDDLHRGVSDPNKSDYPVVADPEEYNVNQLFVEWTGLPKTTVRLGRQQVFLDNWRFVGDIRFRQVYQVFDGIALENKSLPNTDIYLAHMERVKQITTRLRDANVEMANVKYKFTPTESLTGYGYLIDWEKSSVGDISGTSTQTYGLRLNGARKINDKWKVLYTAEYAKQDDYKDGNENIDNHYYDIGAGVGYGDWFIRVDQEKLSGNSDGFAFQTPLGTNHLFQGWADQFLVTPAAGIEDTFITAGGKFKGVTLKAEYHWIDSDRSYTKVGGGQGDEYGEELNLSASYGFTKKLTGMVEYADFNAKDEIAGKPDIQKVWLTMIYKF